MRFERYSDGVLLLELVNAVESEETGGDTPREYTTVGEKLGKADERLKQIFGRVAKRSRLCRWYSQLRGHS